MRLTNLETKELQAKDRRYVFRPSTHLAKRGHGEMPNRIMVSGEGLQTCDSAGRLLFRRIRRAQIGPNFKHHRRTVSKDTSVPLSASISSTSR